jgi:hypothetical protein
MYNVNWRTGSGFAAVGDTRAVISRLAAEPCARAVCAKHTNPARITKETSIALLMPKS